MATMSVVGKKRHISKDKGEMGQRLRRESERDREGVRVCVSEKEREKLISRWPQLLPHKT